MLKKIPVSELKLGMHLQAFCGAWLDHPFWRTKFVLTDPNDLVLVRESPISEVWIDISKGLDVEPGSAAAAVNVEIVEKLPESVPAKIDKTSFNDEVKRASRIVAKGKEAVVSMFQEARMGKAIDTGKAQQLVEEISDSVSRNPGALISLARLKNADDYTYMHSVAVCALMIALARQLGLDPETTRKLGLAGLLHDLGKAAMPMNVLNKPGKLTDEEFSIIKRHPEEGYRMLAENPDVCAITLDVVLHHHEKTDGSGYPKGLKSEEISLHAKMGAVCDVYDAITSNRPYKNGWDPAESLRKMAEWANGHFDPAVFQAFVKSLGIYPVGSLVRLNSGRLGIVIEQSEKSLLSPRVKIFFSTRANARIRAEVLDLSAPGCRDKIAQREDPAHWQFPDLDELWAGIPGAPW